jgi:hypothetical protein
MSQAMASSHSYRNDGADDSGWQTLYRLGGVAALITVAMFVVQVAVFFVSPPPSTVQGYFTLFQSSPLLGLLALDLLILVDQVLGIPLLLALYVSLRRANPSLVVIALLLSVVSMAAYFASNTSFEMLSLSRQYAAATGEAQRAALLAAGEAMLATYTGTAFHVSYIFGSLGLLIASFVMLRSEVYSKATAYVGLVTNVLVFGLYVPVVGLYLSILSVFPFLLIWYIQIALRLFQLARPAVAPLAQPA